jgi:recombination protein RecT
MNQVAERKPKFSVAIQSDAYKNLIASTLGDQKRAQRFVASISSAVATNPVLQECEPGSILSSALLGESLGLSPSPQLGQFYMVPFNRKANPNKGITEAKLAQFQMGYKGYIQLAIRSGFYKKINVLDIKKGELVKFDPLMEEIQVNLIDDEVEREQAETIGYYAMFEYLNGFKKELYWSKAKMLSHADKYSQAFNKEAYLKIQTGKVQQCNKNQSPQDGYLSSQDMWKYSSFWYSGFDGMAFKTMIRQLLSKWGILSVEMTEAFTKDNMASETIKGEFDYIDGEAVEAQPEEKQEKTIEYYSDGDFNLNQEKWYLIIESGRKTHEDFINTIQSKGKLFTAEQLEIIRQWQAAP